MWASNEGLLRNLIYSSQVSIMGQAAPDLQFPSNVEMWDIVLRLSYQPVIPTCSPIRGLRK